MGGVLGRLPVRLAAVSLLLIAALQVIIIAVVIWPDGRPPVFNLVGAEEAALIAELLEETPAAARSRVLKALSASSLSVSLYPAAEPPRLPPPRRSLASRWLRERYAAALQDRPFAVQTVAQRQAQGEADPANLRLLVRLRTGETMAVERVPVALQRLRSRFLVIVGAVGALLVGAAAFGVLQIVRPVERLAAAAQRFATDLRVPDARPEGVEEIRRLALAFNDMKNRIRGLVNERTRMLAAIAHDLRTYLTRLRLRAEYIDAPDQRERAIRDVDEMSQILDDILLFSREEAGEPTAPAPVIDARREVAELVELRRELGEPVTDESGGAGPLPCRCSPMALRRMLGNLADNAIRYGGRAAISAWASPEGVCIAVEDDGPGIPADQLSRVLAPFERLEPSRGRQTGGTGLGLSIVRALAQSQGGELRLENRRGGGLRAVVTLVGAGSAPAGA